VGDELKAERVSAETFDAMVTAHARVIREYCARIYGSTHERGDHE
jgi:hypothetical protein